MHQNLFPWGHKAIDIQKKIGSCAVHPLYHFCILIWVNPTEAECKKMRPNLVNYTTKTKAVGESYAILNQTYTLLLFPLIIFEPKTKKHKGRL